MVTVPQSTPCQSPTASLVAKAIASRHVIAGERGVQTQTGVPKRIHKTLKLCIHVMFQQLCSYARPLSH